MHMYKAAHFLLTKHHRCNPIAPLHNSVNSFALYDNDHLLNLARFYPMNFSSIDLLYLRSQLNLFIRDMRRDKKV